MIGNPNALHDVHRYNGDQHIQIANGNTLPIITVGTVGSYFSNVFVSPDLSTNLVFLENL